LNGWTRTWSEVEENDAFDIDASTGQWMANEGLAYRSIKQAACIASCIFLMSLS
jgi:hypothetical protein